MKMRLWVLSAVLGVLTASGVARADVILYNTFNGGHVCCHGSPPNANVFSVGGHNDITQLSVYVQGFFASDISAVSTSLKLHNNSDNSDYVFTLTAPSAAHQFGAFDWDRVYSWAGSTVVTVGNYVATANDSFLANQWAWNAGSGSHGFLIVAAAPEPGSLVLLGLGILGLGLNRRKKA